MVEGIATFSDWEKIDLRVAEILEVEEIKGADKLFKLKIDLGTETRTLVAGIKQYYTKQELEGKRIIVFTNLEPKTLRGIESQGMLLAASNEDHSQVKLLQPDGAMPLGSVVG
ncbi:methionine--tRNA ligase subunit beta [Candidatus Pacearchaeota archaeon]|nr:methionine--tRNA ligase subunit beta [Candidatus Pacearchaeota archaeon]